MRWEGQSTDEEADRRLPGLERQGKVRTFDAPEAMGVRFHEVEARSALNRVPGESLPFNWTVNPYRGCTHACSYCTSPDAAVLVPSGGTRAMADLQPGDAIYGTSLIDGRRRRVATEVLDHWSARKPAYLIRLEGGVELVGSGDHRFRTEQGWKYVAGLAPGAGRRPRLGIGDRLIGLEADALLRVERIEEAGELDLFDITTGTGDFIADGVISHNCFARPTHRYLDLNAREDFEREIVVKVNVPERLRAELRRPAWKGEVVALGTNTDPYQWVEGRYGLTRAVWEVLIEARNPGSVLTKSPLLLRDVDLMKELHEVAGFQASLSIPTLDEAAWRASEPRTPHPRKRIEAVAALHEAGVPVSVLIAPLMPGINDSPEQVDEILRLCAEAGASSVGGLGLHLKGEVREIFLDWLRGYRPDLLPRYEELYAGGPFLPKGERNRISKRLARGRERAGLRAGSMEERRKPRAPRRREQPPRPRDVADRQPKLF